MEILTLYLRRIFLLSVVFLALFSQIAFAETDAASLEHVLDSMDKAAGNFRTIEADFSWDQFTRAVEQTDTQIGKIYFRKVGKEVEMMADITGPAPGDRRSILFSGSKLQVYLPGPDNKTNQVTTYDTSTHSEVETYLLLGFGGRGHDLEKSFEVTYLGNEKLGGIETGKIKLVPKSEKVRKTFDQIILWIDTGLGISVQQQLFPPLSGDYRLAKYSNIRMPQRLPDNVFKLKTNGKTTFVTP